MSAGAWLKSITTMSEEPHSIESLVAHLLVLLLAGLQSGFVCLLGFTFSFFGLRKLVCQQTVSCEQQARLNGVFVGVSKGE